MDFLNDLRFAGIEKFDQKVWLSSPTMHGDEQKWVDEAIEQINRGSIETVDALTRKKL